MTEPENPFAKALLGLTVSVLTQKGATEWLEALRAQGFRVAIEGDGMCHLVLADGRDVPVRVSEADVKALIPERRLN